MAKLIRNTEEVMIDDNLLKFLNYGEIVKPIPNHRNYFATSMGRIFSGKYKVEYNTLDGEKYYAILWKHLKPRMTNGYLSINITNDEGIRKREYIHSLVYEAFEGFIDRTVLKIVHRDHDKLNNNIGNLALALRKKDDYQAHRSYVYRTKMQETLK